MKAGQTMVSFQAGEDDLARIDELAEASGVNRSEALRRLIASYTHGSPVVSTLVQEYCEGLMLTQPEVVEVFLINQAAQIAAMEETYGKLRDTFMPFMTDARGRLVRGSELFEELYARYSKEFLQDNAEAERQMDELRRDRAKLAAKGKKRPKAKATA